MQKISAPVKRYFNAIDDALDGLDTYLREEDSPLYQHELVGAVVASYLKRLRGSFDSWNHRLAFAEKFRVSQSESGFPAFQNVLDLENDRKGAKKRLSELQSEDQIRREMVDFILHKKAMPIALQRTMAERRYLQAVQDGAHFSPLVLPRTVRVSVNPNTKRPYYIVHWGYFDGASNLPLVYMAAVEDSSEDMIKTLVSKDGKLNKDVEIPLPVDGLLNPQLASKFDEFCDKNSAYSLTLSTIATSMDHDFDHLHPKQVRRFVLGPFYHADITDHGQRVDEILKKVKREENRWLLTWTLQEIYSVHEKPAKWGLWGGDPAREEFHINTNNLDAARMGVSAFERHALVPHEAYQAVFASGEADKIFEDYKTHVISGNQVLRNF
ncbi:MAG: hypothetical protein WBC71_09990 [Salaquimonas sp.]